MNIQWRKGLIRIAAVVITAWAAVCIYRNDLGTATHAIFQHNNTRAETAEILAHRHEVVKKCMAGPLNAEEKAEIEHNRRILYPIPGSLKKYSRCEDEAGRFIMGDGWPPRDRAWEIIGRAIIEFWVGLGAAVLACGLLWWLASGFRQPSEPPTQ
jgi:hypothetical protein